MSAEIAAIVGLAVMFIIATVLPINMGALALVGAFIIGLLAHMPARDIFAGFPGDLFVTLVGITYLFAIAQNNGTIDWLVRRAVWLVRGRIAAIPWVMFTVAGVLTSVGAVSPAAVAIIAPIALRLARKHDMSPLLMGLMVIHGAQAGGFSPMSIYGGITNQVVERAGLPRDDIALFLSSLVFNFAIAVSIFLFFRAHRASRRIDQDVQAPVVVDQQGAAVPLREHAGTHRRTSDARGSRCGNGLPAFRPELASRAHLDGPDRAGYWLAGLRAQRRPGRHLRRSPAGAPRTE